MKIQHASIPHVVTVQLIDTLIAQAASTPMPRIRDAARTQLYSIGVTLNTISNALVRDLEAGDAILNAKTHEEQNEAPETQLWIEWLEMYQLTQQQLQRIGGFVSEEGEAA